MNRDLRVRNLYERLKGNLEASRDVMLEFGVVDACRRCDEEEGGSCCGAGIENKYNPTLLLLNLLWGVDLPDARASANSCFFLGKYGCGLKVRHVLCVNYLCLPIQKKLEGDRLIRLQTTVGDELDTVFLLHETVKKIMSC